MAEYDEYDVSPDWIRDEAANAANRERGRDISWYKMVGGNNIIRILPPWIPQGPLAKTVWSHGGLDKFNIIDPTRQPSDGSAPRPIRTLTCPTRTHPKDKIPCELCLAMAQLRKQTIPDAKGKYPMDFAKPKLRAYINVVDKKDPNPPVGSLKVQVCGISSTVYDWIVIQIANPRIGNIAHPEKGFDVIVNRTGTTLTDTRYTSSFIPSPCPIHPNPEEVKRILAERQDLDKIWNVPDDHYMGLISQMAGVLLTTFGKPGSYTSPPAIRAPMGNGHTTSATPVASPNSVTSSASSTSSRSLGVFGTPPECYTNWGKPGMDVCGICPFEETCKEEAADDVPF